MESKAVSPSILKEIFESEDFEILLKSVVDSALLNVYKRLDNVESRLKKLENQRKNEEESECEQDEEILPKTPRMQLEIELALRLFINQDIHQKFVFSPVSVILGIYPFFQSANPETRLKIAEYFLGEAIEEEMSEYFIDLLSVIKASRLRGPYIPDYYYSCAPNPYYWRFGIHVLDEKTIDDFKTRKLQFIEFKSEEKEEMIINSIPYNPLLDDVIHDPIFRERTFNFTENSAQTILFMEWNQHKHKYAENETFQMVEYKMRTFVSFYVFLPKIRFSLQNALKNLGDGAQLYHLINTANEKYVDICVPRFKIDTEADLGSFVNSIGIEKGLYEDVSNKVLGKTARFVHKVQFELDVQRYKKFEDGFNRDCTGVVDLGSKYIHDLCNGPKLKFLADHPFLFMHVKDTHVVYFGCYQ